MEEKVYTVKGFAVLTGVTERTLRYYDRVGLLKPSKYNEKGHRLYGLDDLGKMQKILTLKYLGYSLSEIEEYANTNTHFLDTLKQQKEMLEKKRDEIDYVIKTISKVTGLVHDNEVDSEILLTIIHSIQHEQAQKNYLSKHMSKELVDQVFLEDIPDQERVEIEKRFIGFLTDFQDLQNKGYKPTDATVQELAHELYVLIQEIIKPELEEELEKIKDEDEAIFQFSHVPKEVQIFIEEAFTVYGKNNKPIEK